MTHAAHHIYIRRGMHAKKVHKKKITPFDNFVMVVSLVYPLSALPQAIEVFTGSVEGVSLLSWLIFWIVSVIFFIYGVIHKVPPMILCNALWFFMDGAIVIGILLHSGA